MTRELIDEISRLNRIIGDMRGALLKAEFALAFTIERPGNTSEARIALPIVLAAIDKSLPGKATP